MPKADVNHSQNATIFVQIASYRDSECQHTVRDLFEKAANPDRIHVGICWQYDPEEDAHCFEVESPRPEQVSFTPFHWKESKGVCWARRQTQLMYQGEDYTLQIDSHMRFIPGWDKELIDQLLQCKSPKPILSASPAPYTPPNQLTENALPTIRRALFFNQAGEMRFKGMYLQKEPDGPLNAAFIAAGFVFSPGSLIADVPYDPFMAFNQEEASLAARYYTHGWDIFSPSRQIVYHYYREPEPAGAPKKEKRPLFWSDRDTQDMATLGQLRYYHLFEHKTSTDPEVIREMDAYGFGRLRSLDDYIQYCGVDYRNHRLDEQKALRCGFIKGLEQWIRRVYVPELDDETKRHPFNLKQLMTVEQAPIAKAPAPVYADEKQAGVNKQKTRPGIISGGDYLELGAFLPFFTLPDQDGKLREVQLYGGKQTQLYFIPQESAEAFFISLKALQSTYLAMDLFQIFIIPGTVKDIADLRQRLRISHHIWADEGGTLRASLGIVADRICGIALSANLQVQDHTLSHTPEAVIAGLVACQKKFETVSSPVLMSAHAPILQVRNVLTADFCKELISYWEQNDRHEGGVGGGRNTRVQKTAKIRTDCFIQDNNLHAKIDERLGRSLFPEIEKVYGLYVTRRESYKVGCYFADDGGFFSMHRDNFEYPLSYRRLAMTLVLNDEYEGGNLLFPEYTSDLYRVGAGDAVIFPCSLVHQVTPVTKGRRYVMISFYYGEAQAEHRAQIRQQQDGTPQPADHWKLLAGLPSDSTNELSRYDNLPRGQWSITRNER